MPISNPVINFQIKPAFEKEINEAQKILVFAQFNTGTATQDTLVENLGNANEQDALFGASSMAATIVRAIRRVSKTTRVDVVALAPGAGAVAATGQIAFTGTATASGTLRFDVGSEINNTYEVAVATDDTAAIVAANLLSAISADTTVPVTAILTVSDLDLTSVDAGVAGAFITLRVSGEVAGISVAITGMSGGAGEPDKITDKSAFALVSPLVRYQGGIYPDGYLTDGLEEFLDVRFNVNNRILDGQAFIGVQSTLSLMKAQGVALDNKNISLVGNQLTDRSTLQGGAIVELNYVTASYFATIRALRLTDDAQIGQYIVGASGALDDIGGAPLASLPYMNTPFTDLLAPSATSDLWSDDDIKELLDSGVSVIGNNRNNTDVIAGQMVTTYLTDTAGDKDVTFKYLNYFDTLTSVREYYFNNFKARFVQSRLVLGKLRPLRNEANAELIKTVMLGLYRDTEKLVLVEDGAQAEKFFKDNLVVTIDKSNGRVGIDLLVIPVTQLREANFVMRVKFNVDL